MYVYIYIYICTPSSRPRLSRGGASRRARSRALGGAFVLFVYMCYAIVVDR